MHDHGAHEAVRGDRTLVLAGNPNTGKSLIFNALTHRYVEVSNFPGTTITVSRARVDGHVLVDAPGVYALEGEGEEERVAREVVETADGLINVIDATQIDRDLYLTLELLETGKPMVVALNMWDEVVSHDLQVDAERLSDLLGVPVVQTVATQGRGLEELVALASRPRVTPAYPTTEHVEMESTLSFGAAALSRVQSRRKRADWIYAQVMGEAPAPLGWRERLSTWLVKPLPGALIAIGVLGIAFYIIGVLVAQGVVELTEGVLFQGYYEPAVRGAFGTFLDGWPLELVAGEFGLFTMTVTYVFGLLLPLVISFYILMSVLEDSGYLPRLATLLDRSLRHVGLNGKAVIPLVLGFGCVTMATITTRMLGSRRERTIAITLLALAIPCSAQMGVILGLLAGLGLQYWLAYTLILGAIFLIIGTLVDRLVPGSTTDFFMELPPLRVPRARNVLQKSWIRTKMFLKDAIPLFFVGAFLLSILQLSGGLAGLQGAMAPLTVSWLGLPEEASNAFVMGFVRRDFGAAGLFGMALDPVSTLVALIVITLFVPCIASVMIIYKEMGAKVLVGVWLFALGTAFFVGGVVRLVLSIF